MLDYGYIYKLSKPCLAYHYLLEANRISNVIERSNNPKLINLCARVKVSYANILFEIG